MIFQLHFGLNGVFKMVSLSWRKITSLALPIAIAQFVQLSVHMVDSAMIGRLGVDYFAAATLIGNYFNLLLIFGLGMATSVRILASRSPMKKEQIFRYALFCAAVYATLVALLSPTLYNFLIQMNFCSSLITTESLIYIKYLGISFFFTMGFILFKAYFETIYRPYIVLAALIGMLLLSVFFNWVLIFGHLGIPSFGIKGAGMSAVLSRSLILSFLICYGFYRRVFSIKNFRIVWAFKNIGWNDVSKSFWKMSFHSSLQQILGWGSFIFLTFLTGTLGSVEVATHQIVSFCSSLPYMFVLGISFAVTILVGEEMGKQNLLAVRLLARRVQIFSLFFISIFLCVYMIFCHHIPKFFVNDTMVVKKTSLLLYILSFYLIFLSFQITTLAVLRGMQDVKIPTLFSFLGFWATGVSCAYFFTYILHLNILGIWLGLILGMGTTAFLFLKRFHYLLKKNQIQEQVL